MTEQEAPTEWDRGYDDGYAAAMAEIMAGEARPLEWNGTVHGDRDCEGCAGMFPESEYGFTLRDELWARIAPRPGADYFGSGVLCLDCIEQRLGREVNWEDVQFQALYGERPTFRAAMLALGPYLAFGEHRISPEGADQ